MAEKKMKYESTNAKNLHKGRRFMYERLAEHHKQFTDRKTGLFFSKLVERRDCPVCDSSLSVPIFQKSGGIYVKCSKCSMVFLNPIFKNLEDYYRKLNTGQAVVVGNESNFYKEIYTKGLRSIEKFSSGGRLLDIGCSSGVFLDIAKKSGWETHGIELNEGEAKICRTKDHVLYTKKLDDLNLKIKFDAITLWDVFEHLPDGKDQLKLIQRHLAPNGVIFMQIPNSGSLATRIMQEKSNMFDGIEHVNLYSPDTLRLVATKSNMKVVNIETVISEIAVLNNYLSYEDPYFGTSKYGTELLDSISADFLHKNLLGYKIQAVLRKTTSK